MKSIKSLFVTALAIVGIFAGIASAQSSLDREVNHKIRSLMNYNTFDYITWQVNGSTVTLTGKTITLGTKREAANSVKDIDGVTSVVNNIDELPPSGFDDRIRAAALNEFTSHGPAQYFGWRNPDVHVVVDRGRITLEGYVSRQSDSNLLYILANSIPGTFGVTNNLVVGEKPKM